MRAKQERYLAVFLLGLLIFLNTVVYKMIQQYSIPTIFPITDLDVVIPYISAFVIPYLALFLFVAVPFITTWPKPKEFLKTNLSFLLVTAISFSYYVFAQTTVLRNYVFSDNIFDQLVQFIYSIDTPVNTFPSMHVATTALTLHIISLKRPGLLKWMAPIGALIILSTLFIKQHNIVDVLGGLAVAALAFAIVFRPKKI
jgi:membrane-associated phospholipid phosphatase